MTLPELPDLTPYRVQTARDLAGALSGICGPSVTIRSERRLAGGSIAEVRLIEMTDRRRLVVKMGSVQGAGQVPGPGQPAVADDADDELAAEARGLLSLGEPVVEGGVRVPRVVALLGGIDSGGVRALVTEYLGAGARVADFAGQFGQRLATLHRARRSRVCGFAVDNFIGATPQPNRPTGDWYEFFGEMRLLYQAELARRQRLIDSGTVGEIERIIDRLPDLLPDVDDGEASLLHGDLWSGNVIADDDGRPAIIDPAVSYGHREADLAMTDLFGGFGDPFYRAYGEVWPLEPGYRSRRDLYNLYHLLNHLNLFGAGYLGSCLAIVRRFR